MIIGETLKNVIKSVHTIRWFTVKSKKNLSIEEYNTFKFFIKTKFNASYNDCIEFELPISVVNKSVVNEILKNKNITIIEACNCNTLQIKGRPLKILEYMVLNNSCLEKIDYKGTIYYVGNGILLDCYFSPLVIITVKFKTKNIDDINTKYANLQIGINDYISPRLLTEDFNIKTLFRSKIIPYITNTTFFFYNVFTSSTLAAKNNVIISDDIYNFIKKPEYVDFNMINIRAKKTLINYFTSHTKNDNT